MSGDHWQEWVGRQESVSDRITPGPVRALAATLNRTDLAFGAGAPIPPLWTWLYFLQAAPMSSVGADGHPKRGGFLPPVPLERRMWAGGRCTFHRPVLIGDFAERTSTIMSVSEKNSRSGTLVFVTVRHELQVDGLAAITEEQDIVYLAIPDVFTPPVPVAAPPSDWSESVSIDPVLLFRFSALTFNGHRIHYDREYARQVEHYPGLVVHGPLQAVLLFDAATRRVPGGIFRRFDFRSFRPVFDSDSVAGHGRAGEAGEIDLFTEVGGAIAMRATLSDRLCP